MQWVRDSEPEPEAKHVVKLKTINSRSNLTIQLPKSEAENSSRVRSVLRHAYACNLQIVYLIISLQKWHARSYLSRVKLVYKLHCKHRMSFPQLVPDYVPALTISLQCASKSQRNQRNSSPQKLWWKLPSKFLSGNGPTSKLQCSN